MELDKYQRMKKQAEGLRVKAERAAGKVEQLMAQLKEQFDCDTIEEAQEKLKALEKKKNKSKQAFDRAYKLFEAEWGEKLEALAS